MGAEQGWEKFRIVFQSSLLKRCMIRCRLTVLSSSSAASSFPCTAFFSPTHLYLWPQQVCVLGLHLAKELCEVDEDGDSWLQVTRRLPILPTLFTTLEVSLRMKQNLHFTEAALHLLLTLARTQQVGGKHEAGRSLLVGAEWVLALPLSPRSSGLL